MLKSLGVLVVLVGACSAVPVRADDFAPVKCGTNQERVWVYESLTTFDVQAQIRCGENVQIIGRVKGYIKVRIKNGSEGYVAESSLPNLLPLEDNSSKPADGNVPAPTDSLGDIARRLAANSATAAARPAAASSPISNPSESHAPATNSVAARAPITPQPTETAKAAPVSAPIPVNIPTAPTAVKTPVAPSAPAIFAASPTAPIATPRPVPSQEVAAAAGPAPSPKPVYTGSGRAVAASAKAKVGSAVQPPVINANPAPPPSSPAPAMPKLQPPATTETVANIPAMPPTREVPGIRKVSATADSEDFTDFQPISESADPACQTYFSAYGLAPSQIKWISQNRKKEFPSVCPAPDPSRVDFVVIFTHDFSTYSSTLPTPVHTDRNGFSDFSATVGVDTAALSNDDADRAHRQFVWVFTMKRGAFDPAAFSPRRRYQYTKMEAGSKASVKSIEDAFEFFTQQASSR